ncbi:O-antigen ligase family protein [Patescibacteria group bacterium]|nr:O-antigen ligase family protein [Patescibacteria group bacterium]MBU4458360.1 O-antigen ligase family protein [Patescibacteria group bacterium]MCG2695885.1 O-antigen ligase family protein [Candidatus Portnoybacteria bacterium]
MVISEAFAKILRWGVFISLFLPLVIFSQYLSPFHFGKVIIFRILVGIMAVFYIPLIIVDKRYRPKWTMILISISVFAFLYLFSGLVGNSFYSSFWGTIERMGGIFSFLHYLVYFLILISIIKKEVDWDKILKVSLFVGFLSILFAYGQRLKLGNFFVGWQHGDRVIGTIGNPALFAGYLLFILYLAILFLSRKITRPAEKGFFAAILILGVPVLLMTAVRGAIISFFGSLLLLALFFLFFQKSRRIKILLLVAIIVFVIFGTIIWLEKNKDWVKNNSLLQRITDISFKSDTIQTRLWSWESAINGWKEKPIFGWGPENFTFLHMKYFDSRHFSGLGSETIWDRAHNIILEMLSTMGIVGLLSYIFIFFSIFYILIKKFKQKQIENSDFGIIIAMLIAYIGQNLFIFDTFANYFLFFLILGYINNLHLKEETYSIPTKEPSVFLAAILLVFVLILTYQTGIKPAKANYACTRAIVAGQRGDANEAFQYYKKALSYDNPQVNYDITHKLATFTIQLIEAQRQKNKTIDVNLAHYTIEAVKKNIERFSLDTTPYLYVGRMYILLIDEEADTAGKLAEEFIGKALDLNRKNPRIWYELGQAQLSLDKYKEAYDSFKEALNLNPQVAISYWFLGMAAYENGQYDSSHYQEAAQLVEKAIVMGYNYKGSINDLMRLVHIYDKVGNYSKIVEVYKLAILKQPSNAQLHASLAAAYAKIGDYENAKKEALKSAEIDPNFKSDAEKFINSLPR